MKTYLKATAIESNTEYELRAERITLKDGCPVEITDPVILVNGKETEDFGKNWVGQDFYVEEVAVDLVRFYMNNNTELRFSIVDSELVQFKESFTKTIALKAKDNWILREIIGRNGTMLLEMVDTDLCSYYIGCDECCILRPDGSIATDMEEFYANAIYDNIETAVWKRYGLDKDYEE